jgi:hypothetical protein
MADQPHSDDEFDRALLADLDRRVAELSATPPHVFGVISSRELLLATLATIVLPLVVVWAFS